MRTNVTPGKTPPEISVMQIDQDLKDGVSNSEMAIKYGIKPWEVDEMFKHPFLKGRRPSRKKALSFKFVDDTDTSELVIPEIQSIPQENIMPTDDKEVDPNQMSLESVIDEAIESCEEAKEELTQAVSEIDKLKDSTMSEVEEQDWTAD